MDSHQIPLFNPDLTRNAQVKQVVEFVENFRRGDFCPTCGVKTVEWKKRLISTAIASLIRLVAVYSGNPIHHDKFTVLKKDRNFSQLVNWELVMPGLNEDCAKRSAGEWSPTQKGIDFVRKKITIPTYIVTWNNMFIRFEGPPINVEDALNDRFNYEELLMDNF